MLDGQYDINWLYKMVYNSQNPVMTSRELVLEYLGPIEAKLVPGKGRGLFATEHIRQG